MEDVLSIPRYIIRLSEIVKCRVPYFSIFFDNTYMPKELENLEDFEEGEEEKEDERLPPDTSTFPTLPALKVPSAIKANDTTKFQVIRQDAEMYHSMFTGLSYAWSQVSSIDEIVKLALTTSKLIQERRKALCLPLGAPADESEKDDRFVLPLD